MVNECAFRPRMNGKRLALAVAVHAFAEERKAAGDSAPIVTIATARGIRTVAADGLTAVAFDRA